jgi:ribosomal protein S18 acetylase RimI-like enzyme
MIKQLQPVDFPLAVEVIRSSFATVAEEFELTEQNCPMYTSYSTTVERLERRYKMGMLIYGLYIGDLLIGSVTISENDKQGCEVLNLAVLPKYRHKGYGKQLLYFCIDKAKEMKCNKIWFSFNADNTLLKNWYIENGFVLTELKRLDVFPFIIGYMERAI